MEATFISAGSSKTLTLTSYSPSILTASSLRSIRHEFLGCCHNLRPPGGFHLRSRARIRKSGRAPIQSSPFVFTASLDSRLILVVVAVATFSGIAVAYFHHLNSRKRKDLSEKSNILANGHISTSPATFRGGKDSTENPLEIEVPNDGDIVYNGKHVEINGRFERRIAENTDKLKEEADQIPEPAVMQHDLVLTKPSDPPINGSYFSVAGVGITDQIQQPAVTQDDLILTKPSDPPSDDSQFFSVASVSIHAHEHDVMDEVHASSLPQGYTALESAMMRAKPPENQAENCDQEKGLDFNVPRAMVGIHSFASSHVVGDIHAAEYKYDNLHQRLFGYDIFMESPREELHTFYGSNHLVANSLSITSPKVMSPSAVSSSTDSLSLHHKAVPDIMEMHLSGESSHQATGDVKEKKLVPHGKGGLSQKREEVRHDWRHVIHQVDESMQHFPNHNGDLANSSGHPSETLDAYNRLLRYGRLTDCINLLEDMEQSDLLDMDKIHHASFFKICKKKKAVKEAFRFIKLVPNPTLSTFNMLMSVCASSQDTEGAREVLRLVQETGMIADCKLYTTLISTCAKSGKVDAMFEVFHQMTDSGVEPNVHTFGALIDGCARAGQVAKAFGAYGILRSKNVKPDRVVFNALISACGQSGVVDRAFDVLAEMRAEAHPIDPDHITVGALMKACFNAGQVERAKEVYKMIHEYNIRGTPEVYTIAVNSCSKSGDWEFACSIYNDMKKKGVTPDEVFFSALIDVAGHAGRLDDAFGIIQEAKSLRKRLGPISYSSLMGACCNAKNWQKALELYEKIKSIKLRPTVSTMNALITALCHGDQLPKAMEILDEIKALGLTPNTITYSMLIMESERKDDLEASLMLLSRAKEDSVSPNLIMCKCITSMCMQRFERACAAGEPVLSFKTGRPQIENKWTSLALTVYRETILGGTIPSTEVLSQVLGCLRLPHDASLRDRLIRNLGLGASSQRRRNLFSLVDGFGEYDPRAFSLLEEATSLGILPSVSFKKVPIVFDSTKLHTNVAEAYLLTILKGFKHRLAAGAKLPNINVLLPVEKRQVTTPEGEKTINLAGRVGQAIAALLRRLGIPYQRKESSGKIRINGPALRNWFQPKPTSSFGGKLGDLKSSQARLGKQIIHQQRNIRTGNLSFE